jgi:hypothetical protein
MTGIAVLLLIAALDRVPIEAEAAVRARIDRYLNALLSEPAAAPADCDRH